MTRRLLPVVALACALAAAPASARAEAQWLGFNDNSTVTGDLTAERSASLTAQTGANAVRMGVEWRFSQSFGGPIDLSRYRPVYEAMRARRIRPVLTVMSAPQWAWTRWYVCFSGDCHVPPDRSHDDDWATFVSTVTREFPAAAAIEIWNEPNLGGFFAPAPNPGRYAELLRIGRDAVKSVDPTMPVLGASLAPIIADVQTPQAHGLRPFLSALYAEGARGLMDGISVHGYPDGIRPRRIFDALRATIEVRDAAGDDVPLWVTEVGASTTGGFTPIAQAILLARVLPRLVHHPEVAAVFVHTLVEPRRMGGIERGYGVLAPGGVPKPAFCVVARVFGGPASCPARAAG